MQNVSNVMQVHMENVCCAVLSVGRELLVLGNSPLCKSWQWKKKKTKKRTRNRTAYQDGAKKEKKYGGNWKEAHGGSKLQNRILCGARNAKGVQGLSSK